MIPHDEAHLFIALSGRRSGPREFVFFWGNPVEGGEWVHPIELLGLGRTTALLNKIKTSHPELSLVLALCRLLVPCLRYRGSGRHIVVERWTAGDLRGENLPADTRTEFASELALAQKTEWNLVVAGQRPPEGSLAEAFWEAQADLPFLPEQFDDPELGRFAKAMYRFLVPPGAGIAEVSTSEISSKVNGLRKTGFTRLALGRSPRHLNKLFRKLLAVTVKFCSQLTGEVAAELVRDYLHHYPALAGGPTALSDDERSLLDFRYGACHDLGNINVGFFYGNGFLVGLLLNKLYMHYALASPETEREKAAADLHVFMHLLRKYRGRRKLARAQERRANRQRSPRARRPGQREAAEQPDRRAKNPGKLADQREKLEFVRDRVLPHLRPHDRRRLEAMLAADGVRAEAAKSLGITLTTFSRQWRQTTSPNIQRVIRELKFDDSE